MNKIFFTSDHHFGHANIIKFCNRPFVDVHEMNEILIQKWNEKVSKNDSVYHLGDFGFGYKENLEKIIDRLNGKIYLILGNHDKVAVQCAKKFVWIKEYFELKVPEPDNKNGYQNIILFHYAMRVWRSDFRGSWHLYGHSHGTLPDKNNQLSFDIGVDCHNVAPLSYEEVKAIMKTKNWTSPF